MLGEAVTMCRKGRSEVMAKMAAISGDERGIWELMEVGSVRGRRKVSTLLRILRRWTACLDGTKSEGLSTTISSSTTISLCSQSRCLPELLGTMSATEA